MKRMTCPPCELSGGLFADLLYISNWSSSFNNTSSSSSASCPIKEAYVPSSTIVIIVY